MGLIFIGVIIAFFLRRIRKKKLLDEAVSFEPTSHHRYADEIENGYAEKERASLGSDGLAGASTYSQTGYPMNHNHNPPPPLPVHGYDHYNQGAYPTYTSPSQLNQRAYDGYTDQGPYPARGSGYDDGQNPGYANAGYR